MNKQVPEPSPGEKPARGPAADGVYSVTRVDQMRALAHPLRLRLLEVFALAPRTTKQAAEFLGENPTRLYHHVALLERVGFLHLRETRRNRGTVEKYYEAVASLIRVDSSLFGKAGVGRGSAATPKGMALDLLEEARNEVASADAARPPKLCPAVVRLLLHASEERLTGFQDDFVAWVKEWARDAESESRTGPSPSASVTLAIVPSATDRPAQASRRRAPRPSPGRKGER